MVRFDAKVARAGFKVVQRVRPPLPETTVALEIFDRNLGTADNATMRWYRGGLPN